MRHNNMQTLKDRFNQKLDIAWANLDSGAQSQDKVKFWNATQEIDRINWERFQAGIEINEDDDE